MRKYVLLSAVIFDAMTALQLARLALRWPVVVNGFGVPLWVSGVAAVIVGAMAVWAMRLLMRMPSSPVVR